MDTMTLNRTEELLKSKGGKIGFGVRFDRGRFSASCHWPNGDVIRDAHCYGSGVTLGEAIAKMEEKIEEVKNRRRPLRTASECKAAVIDLIREHEAAPASFRDAVDALPVER